MANVKMVKNLTKANIRNIEGMARREDLDFHDDGNNFRGFSYKGMPITTLRSGDLTYLSIRVDYLENNFTFKEWMMTEEFALTEKFNGVYEFDVNELIENLEKVIAKVNEMNEEAAKDNLDMTEVAKKLKEEIQMATKVLEDAKENFKWYEVESPFTLSNMIKYIKYITNDINYLMSIDVNNLSIREKKEMIERLKKYDYVRICRDNYFLKEIKLNTELFHK